VPIACMGPSVPLLYSRRKARHRLRGLCPAGGLARSRVPVILARGEYDAMNTDEQIAQLASPQGLTQS
jgi:hypothetical protein